MVAAQGTLASATGFWLKCKADQLGVVYSTESRSSVTLTLAAHSTANAEVKQGDLVSDEFDQHLWSITADTTVTAGSTATVQAICVDFGAVEANSGTLTKIVTPKYAWVSVTNADDAIVGTVDESDDSLRRRCRQAASSVGVGGLSSIYTAIANLDNVDSVLVKQNPTSQTTIDGIPPYSVWCIVRGGDNTEVATAIASTVFPGVGTHGAQTVTIKIPVTVGNDYDINFDRPSETNITIAVSTISSSAFPDNGAILIADAVDALAEAVDIGGTISRADLIVAAMAACSGHRVQSVLINSLNADYVLGATNTANATTTVVVQ